MCGKPIIKEQYINGDNVINYVVYKSKTGDGNDEVLQHKIFGTTETSHITQHPDGTINFRIKQSEAYLKHAILSNMIDFEPELSQRVKQFIINVLGKI